MVNAEQLSLANEQSHTLDEAINEIDAQREAGEVSAENISEAFSMINSSFLEFNATELNQYEEESRERIYRAALGERVTEPVEHTNWVKRTFNRLKESLLTKVSAPRTKTERLQILDQQEDLSSDEIVMILDADSQIDAYNQKRPGAEASLLKQQHNRIITEVVKRAHGLDKKPKKGDSNYEQFMEDRCALVKNMSWVRYGNSVHEDFLNGELNDATVEDSQAETADETTKDKFLTILDMPGTWILERFVRVNTWMDETKQARENGEDVFTGRQKAVGALALTALGVGVAYLAVKGVDAGEMLDTGKDIGDSLSDQTGNMAEGGQGTAELTNVNPSDAIGEGSSSASAGAESDIGFIDSNVVSGEGITDTLKTLGAENGIEGLTDIELYEVYEQFESEFAKLDGVYEMGNGDYGIQSTGSWEIPADLAEELEQAMREKIANR